MYDDQNIMEALMNAIGMRTMIVNPIDMGMVREAFAMDPETATMFEVHTSVDVRPGTVLVMPWMDVRGSE